MAKKALGKGLNALIPQNNKNLTTGNEIDIALIIPNENQPRKYFPQEELQGLADSIKTVGIIEPLVVRKLNNKYEIITGERRWRASKLANLKKLPVVIKDVTDNNILEIALIENIQRQDLNPIEEAMAYKELLHERQLKQDELAKRLGKSRVTITNSIRLLNLPKKIQQYIIDGKISAGHARALLSIKTKTQMETLADKTIKNKLSVRELESLTGKLLKNKSTSTNKKTNKSTIEISDLETQLEETLGTKVNIRHGKKGGKIEIIYFDLDDLDRILEVVVNE